MDIPTDDTNNLITNDDKPYVNFVSDLGVPIGLLVVENEPCNMKAQSNLDHIQLVRYDEVFIRITHVNSLFSVIMDPPMPSPHARNKIGEITFWILREVIIPLILPLS